MIRLKIKDVPAYRQTLAEKQGLACGLCGYSLAGKVANLDHDHKTGLIRAVLCRQCNTLLGKIENFLNTYGHDHPRIFLSRAWGYILDHKNHPSEVYHPSYKTAEEKKAARNEKARLRRRNKK